MQKRPKAGKKRIIAIGMNIQNHTGEQNWKRKRHYICYEHRNSSRNDLTRTDRAGITSAALLIYYTDPSVYPFPFVPRRKDEFFHNTSIVQQRQGWWVYIITARGDDVRCIRSIPRMHFIYADVAVLLSGWTIDWKNVSELHFRIGIYLYTNW